MKIHCYKYSLMLVKKKAHLSLIAIINRDKCRRKIIVDEEFFNKYDWEYTSIFNEKNRYDWRMKYEVDQIAKRLQRNVS